MGFPKLFKLIKPINNLSCICSNFNSFDFLECPVCSKWGHSAADCWFRKPAAAASEKGGGSAIAARAAKAAKAAEAAIALAAKLQQEAVLAAAAEVQQATAAATRTINVFF